MSVYYIRNHEIDISAWDKCIATSFHGSIYSFSWYLDLVCENWDALVEDDYQSVMPLPTQRFLGKEIISMPVFLNELGIFSALPVNQEKTRAFINAIPNKFAYYSIVLNKYNQVDPEDINLIFHTHYELDLIKSYYKLSGDYDLEIQNKINQAVTKGYSFITGLSPNDLIQFIAENKIRVSHEISRNNFRRMRSIIAGLISYKSGGLYGVYNEFNELVSVALFAWINSQINTVFHVVTRENTDNFAHLYLIDRFVEKYAETNTTLVFDAAIISLSPDFYKCFGTHEASKIEIIRNTLPFPLNILFRYKILRTFLSSLQAAAS